MLSVNSETPVRWTPNWALIPEEELIAIQAAGLEVKFWMEVLARTGDTVMTDFLRGVDELYVDQFYPEYTVEDHESSSQYYFHAHSDREAEYGHFHAYIMPSGLPEGMRAPKPAPAGEHEDAFATHCHLVAISMADGGLPASLFTINHWSSQEACYTREQVAELLSLFDVNHAAPSWPSNRWLTSMLRFFRPQILELLRMRHAVLTQRAVENPGVEPEADEEVEVTSQIPIDVDAQLIDVTREINRRQAGSQAGPLLNTECELPAQMQA